MNGSSGDTAPRMLGLVWAQSRDGVIGRDGTLPWHVPEDLAHFRAVTAGCPVIMGRATWESLPPRFRPLPGRENLVLSRQDAYVAEGACVVPDLPAALRAAAGHEAWVIGGGSVYRSAIDSADRLELTEVDVELCEASVSSGRVAAVPDVTLAPPVGDNWQVVSRDPAVGWHTSVGGPRFRFVSYRRSVGD